MRVHSENRVSTKISSMSKETEKVKRKVIKFQKEKASYLSTRSFQNINVSL